MLAQKRHRTEDSQSPLAAQIPKEVLVKAHSLVTVSRFMGTIPLLGCKALEAHLSIYYHGVLSPAWQTQRQSLPAIPAFGADNAVWRHQGAAGLYLLSE